ncbi:MAG: polyhydroxyalkanoic acid synthase [Chelatococcus sp.]|nr:MAG: polyhydroxyalkanoic acid synthase [Chelatococcus sp.]
MLGIDFRAKAMKRPVTITISQDLGREATLARLRDGMDRVRDRLGTVGMQLAEERWEGDTLHFGVAALGHTVNGRVSVEDAHVRIEVMLPWMLAVFAEKLKLGVEKQGRILLEKPKA